MSNEILMQPEYTAPQIMGMMELAFECRKALMLWGPPGIGKSQLVNQAAGDRPVVDIRLLLRDPTDIKGIPYYDEATNTMKWAIPSELPSHTNGLSNCVLFLDEITAAPPQVQAAAYQLVLDYKVGEYELPDDVDIILAGNRVSDRGVAYEMPSPLVDRMIHTTMKVSVDAWIDWAISKKINSKIVAFIMKTRLSNLFNFDPKSPDLVFATPRGWEFVSEIMAGAERIGSTPTVVRAMIEGKVGVGTTKHFYQHLKFAEQLPDPMKVLNGQVTEFESEEISPYHALSVSLGYALAELQETESKDNFMVKFDNFLRFTLDNFKPEMVVLAIRSVFMIHRVSIDHKKSEHWLEFSERYAKYLS